MPFITKQGDSKCLPSILEYNLRHLTYEQSWVSEWNTYGIESGLDEKEYKSNKTHNILISIASYVRANLATEEKKR